MNTAGQIFANLLAWTKAEEPIRALILVGSRAQPEQADELADIDATLFTRTYAPYIRDDHWMSAMGNVWVYVPDKIQIGSNIYPTRLVIYEGGVKVDFAFYTTDALAEMEWDSPYKILLDKDDLAAQISMPVQSPRNHPPTEKEFVALVNEFWFEAYHVAKYLARGELWLVKSRDWGVKELLLRMIEWHSQSRHQGQVDTYYMGKHMQSWVDPITWEALGQAFAHFDGEDSWRGLFATTRLFRQLGVETAKMFGYAYPYDVDQNINGFMQSLGREK